MVYYDGWNYSIFIGSIVYGDELRGAKKVLSAAAMTYLAGTAASILQLLRLLLLTGGRRRNDQRIDIGHFIRSDPW